MALLLLPDSGIQGDAIPEALPSLWLSWSFGGTRTQLESQGPWLQWRRPESGC